MLADALAGHTSLRELNLHGSSVGPVGMTALVEPLSRCHSLAEVFLGFNKIGAAGATVLSRCLSKQSLVSLDLFDNEIASEGATAIAEGLRQALSLRVLDLGSNGIGADGLSSLKKSLMGSPSLQHLGLKSNPIDATTVSANLIEFVVSTPKLQVLALDSSLSLRLCHSVVDLLDAGNTHHFCFHEPLISVHIPEERLPAPLKRAENSAIFKHYVEKLNSSRARSLTS